MTWPGSVLASAGLGLLLCAPALVILDLAACRSAAAAGWHEPGQEKVHAMSWTFNALGAGCLLVSFLCHPSWPEIGWVMLALLPTFYAASVDRRDRIIPDDAALLLLVAGLYGSPFCPDPQERINAVCAMILAYGVMGLCSGFIRERRVSFAGLSGGDLLISTAFSAWVGLIPGFLCLLVAHLVCILICSFLPKSGRRGARLAKFIDWNSNDRTLPLGPFLAFGFWVVLSFAPLPSG